jgi:hypothetical protein
MLRAMGFRTIAGLLIAGFVVVVVAVASAEMRIGVEPPGPAPLPVMVTTWESAARLTGTAPVAVRAVRVDVAPTANRLQTPDLDLVVRGPGQLDDPAGSGVWISIFDAGTGAGTPNPAGSGHATLDGWIGSGHGFAECAKKACSVTYLLVARLRAPTPDASIPITFSANLSATVMGPTSWAIPSGPTPSPKLEGLALTDVAGDRFDGVPAIASAETNGSLRITTRAPVVETHLRLHVPAADLGRDRRYPVLGHALLTVPTAASSGQFVAPWLEITGPHGTIRALAGIALDVDWLAGCPVGLDCDVPITVRGVFGSSPPGVAPSLPPDAWATADWVLSVRLERFDRDPGSLSSGLTLTTVDP